MSEQWPVLAEEVSKGECAACTNGGVIPDKFDIPLKLCLRCLRATRRNLRKKGIHAKLRREDVYEGLY